MSKVPMVLATVGVAISALWMVQWLAALALSWGLIDPGIEGVRASSPSAGEVALGIVRHVGPLIAAGALLLLTRRYHRGCRHRESWLVASLACGVPLAAILF